MAHQFSFHLLSFQEIFDWYSNKRQYLNQIIDFPQLQHQKDKFIKNNCQELSNLW